MTKIVNLTPHAVNVATTNGIMEIPASGWELRLEAKTVPSHGIATQYGHVSITTTKFGSPVLVEGKNGAKIEKPDLYEGDTLFIVSQIALNGLSDNPFLINRGQFVVPAQVQRDETGKITHCLSFGL
jgi:hypothetical protein